jgi:hypothetical protein
MNEDIRGASNKSSLFECTYNNDAQTTTAIFTNKKFKFLSGEFFIAVATCFFLQIGYKH